MKKQMLMIVIFVVASFGVKTQAQDANPGGPYLEPNIYYQVGQAYFSSPSNIISYNGKLEGFGVGTKAGFHVWEIGFAGLDVMYMLPRFTDTEGRYSTNTRTWLVGFMAGAQMPIVGFRVWAGFLPFGQTDQDRDRGYEIKLSNPNLFKLGAGFAIMPFSINLEYLWGTYGKTEVTNNNATVTAIDGVSARTEGFLLGVSFPLSL